MNIENEYFLASFQNKTISKKVLIGGPWIIFGQYLTVQLWIVAFNLVQPYSSIVMTWIRLPGLPGYMYKRNILKEIGGTIGKVAKLDLNTDSRIRGHFARLAVYVNLDKPLISQIQINGTLQKVKYEFLRIVCFGCGKYNHLKDVCLNRGSKTSVENKMQPLGLSSVATSVIYEGSGEEGGSYGP
ncbi:uncharacterized protein [Gossypium hirsutum]|uniref:DUF4283 domain-containing protein n=1 Tax=Gossypium hirsutum TaxID=3635 RepID=A0A1U8KCG4_GOSHI|nr:uncharacterized protein LOC107915541 [Gossypium hirsutum]